MKIQWKSMYVKCINRMNLFRNLNLLNVQNCENSRKESEQFLNSEQKIIYAKKKAYNDGFACWIPKSL